MVLHALKHLTVVFDACLIRLGVIAVGIDACPVDGHAVCLESHLRKQGDVFFKPVILPAAKLARIGQVRFNGSSDAAGMIVIAVGHVVQDRFPFSVSVISAFTLACGRGSSPEESFRDRVCYSCHFILLLSKRPGQCPDLPLFA